MPAVRRDLSFWVSEDVVYADIAKTIENSFNNALQKFKFIDFYKNDAEGLKKSFTVALYFQDYTKTLTDEEVNQGVSAVMNALKTAHSVEIRSS